MTITITFSSSHLLTVSPYTITIAIAVRQQLPLNPTKNCDSQINPVLETKAPTNTPTATPTSTPTATPTATPTCGWTTHVDKVSADYACSGHNTTYSLADAKAKCLEFGPEDCKAVTCSSGGECTVRASDSTSLSVSSSSETTYTMDCGKSSSQIHTP